MTRVLFFLYAVFLLGITVFSYVFIDFNLLYFKPLYTGFATNEREITTGIYIGIIFLFFIFYLIFLSLFRKKRLTVKEMKWIVAISVALLFFSYPAMLSYDVFNYVTTAKILFFYHENPYITMPIEFSGEPFLSFTRATNKVALYGPLWLAITALPYVLSFGSFILLLASFKLLVVLFYLGTLFIIWRLSNDLFSVFLFALNPLVLLEVLVSNHNDIVMMFLVLLALLCIMKKRIFVGLIFFICSILIKYASLFLLPIFLYVIWKNKKEEKINWSFVFYNSSISMLVIFFLSFLREEIYPWYAIWFLSLVCLVYNRKLLLNISLVLSFSLLLRYIPYMFLGTYAGLTPVIKSLVTFIPVCFVWVYLVIKKNIWPNISQS